MLLNFFHHLFFSNWRIQQPLLRYAKKKLVQFSFLRMSYNLFFLLESDSANREVLLVVVKKHFSSCLRSFPYRTEVAS